MIFLGVFKVKKILNLNSSHHIKSFDTKTTIWVIGFLTNRDFFSKLELVTSSLFSNQKQKQDRKISKIKLGIKI
jgi:hypothetical protein